MQDKNNFDPEKIALVDFKITKDQVNAPENFNNGFIIGYKVDNSFQMAFGRSEKLAKADLTVNITSDSQGKNRDEANGSFHLVFIYRIENFEELVTIGENNRLNLNPLLANALASVTYSTSRGILLTRMQGTVLQNFVLPIINPNSLIRKK